MKNRGKLIVIEGSDGSGKATQSKLLYERLLSEGKNVRLISFPNYESSSSSLVKMYLNGDFGDNPEDSNIYAVSSFFAVDRYASYKEDWGKFYNDGGIIIADRYTTSNMVHQCAKLETKEEKNSYLDWLWDLEFNKYGLPIPDKVFFLDVDPNISKLLMESRPNKITNEDEKDIHEKNNGYMLKSYLNAKFVAKKYSWEHILCTSSNKMREVLDIGEEIYERFKEI